jgi:hypothetical protein
MARKYVVSFSAPTSLSPCVVYVSQSSAYPDKFSVAVLHPVGSVGSFDSPEGICRSFDLHQGLLDIEQEALDWAIKWLELKSGCSATLKEMKG